MRPSIRIALSLTMACALAPGHAQQVVDPAQTSVWIDVTRDKGVRFNGYTLPRAAEGMGVVITPSREIATAAHVVWQARRITIADAKGAKAQAHVVCIDPKVDVALLRVERPFSQFANLRSRPAGMGEPVIVVERPDPDEEPNLSSGLIGALRWTSHGVPVPLIFSGIKGEKGMSGGGLFDAKGELLGIVIRIEGVVGYLSALPVAELCTRFGRCASGTRPAAQAQACGAVEAPAMPAMPASSPEPRAPVRRIADRAG
jgi:S1-C subfamily serine protease